MQSYRVMAHIHSLGGELREVTVISYLDANNVVVEYNGKHYTAIYNVFVSAFYVDDLYGEVN